MIKTGTERVNVGEFTTKVKFYAPTQIKNERAAIENKYNFDFDVYAMVEEQGASETIDQMNNIALDTLTIVTYSCRVENTHRAKYNGRYYDVVKIQQVYNQPFVEITATLIND